VALGVMLVIGAAVAFTSLYGLELIPVRSITLGVVVIAGALALMVTPWWLWLARGLAEERAERLRSQHRAEVAAQLHDSVLQTLTLMQKRAEDPRAVATLARHQERELRAWLSGSDPAPATTLAAALQTAVAELEDDGEWGCWRPTGQILVDW
jgi:signal transduction histidine kinase